jgi:hypothetical protein
LDSRSSSACSSRLRPGFIMTSEPQPTIFDLYHLELGRFVAMFSQVERTLLRALWTLARIRDPVSQAVLSGVRIEGAIGLINRIAEAENWSTDRRAKWQHVFTQLGAINKLRNDILHHGAGLNDDDKFVVSNRHTAHHPNRVREVLFTPATLGDAFEDLNVLMFTLILLVGPKRMGLRIGGTRTLKQYLEQPWRYKSQQPNPGGQKTPGSRPKPRRQPPSSRA